MYNIIFQMNLKCETYQLTGMNALHSMIASNFVFVGTEQYLGINTQ